MDRTQKGKKQTSKKGQKKAKNRLVRGPFAKNSHILSQNGSLSSRSSLATIHSSKNSPSTKSNNTKKSSKSQNDVQNIHINEVYFPQEDSNLLKEVSKNIAKGVVLEMGCGSGYVLCSLSGQIEFGIGLDINPLAVKASEKYAKIESEGNLWFFQSNLFSFLESFSIEIFMNRMWLRKGKTQKIFDYILFNPPYLPDEFDNSLNDIALNGGKEGTQVIERFLRSFRSYLKSDGKALIIISSIIKEKFLALLEKYKIHFILLDKKGLFYEELYCYQLW